MVAEMLNKKYKKDNRNYTIHIKFTKDEYEELKRLASEDMRTICGLCYKVLKGVLGI